MLIMADKKSNTKSSSEQTFVAKISKRLGSKRDGSPKIEVKRGQDLGTLSKDDQDLYRKYKIID